MNIDKTIKALEEGFQSPQTSLYRTLLPDEYMEGLHIRRKVKGATHHQVWCFSIGEAGAQPAVFYDHRPTGALKKALAWRGLPTSSRRRRNGSEESVQQG